MYGSANLRISYIGGGYDFPRFFASQEVRIISEGLPLCVNCHKTLNNTIHWHLPKSLRTGLGSSAARHLSFIHAKFPAAPFRDQVSAAIHLDGLQAGGWQDVIASAYHGLI